MWDSGAQERTRSLASQGHPVLLSPGSSERRPSLLDQRKIQCMC